MARRPVRFPRAHIPRSTIRRGPYRKARLGSSDRGVFRDQRAAGRTMKQRRPFPVVEAAVAAFAVVLLAVAAYLTGNQVDAQRGKYDSMSTYDAASGGYRAWYALLQQEGVRVERFERRPAVLDASVDVYVSASNAFDTIA